MVLPRMIARDLDETMIGHEIVLRRFQRRRAAMKPLKRYSPQPLGQWG